MQRYIDNPHYNNYCAELVLSSLVLWKSISRCEHGLQFRFPWVECYDPILERECEIVPIVFNAS